MNASMTSLNPWAELYNVIILLSPIFLFSIASSVAIYVVLVLGPTFLRSSPGLGVQPPTAPETGDEFGYVGRLSYLILSSLFGLSFGMLVKLVGGFSALDKGANLTGAISTVLVIVLGVAGSMFAESGRLNLRKPVGAIAFLTSFLVSGFYWKLLEH